MKIYYSAQTGGFYSDDINGARQIQMPDPAWQRPTIQMPDPSWQADQNADGDSAPLIAVPDFSAQQPLILVDNPDCKIPVDAVEITADQHAALMTAQSQGKKIQSDQSGSPVAMDAPALSADAILKQQIAALEATATPRRMREAALGADAGWLAALDAQIVVLRKKL